jgi:uroporphyrinogen-III synthase
MTRFALVTRHPAECAELRGLLSPHGWSVRPYPVLRVEDVNDDTGWAAAQRLVAERGRAVWLALTSPRAPNRLVRQSARRGVESILELPIAAVGPGTARSAERAGLRVELVGPGTGAQLAERMVPHLEPGSPVILVCGRDRRPELPEALEGADHPVQPLVVYAMVPTPPRELPPLGEGLAAVVLTSPRAARLYLEGIGGRPLPIPHWALGPTTQDAASALGIDCRIPSRPDLESLVEELCTR